jgi:hypothetical protein
MRGVPRLVLVLVLVLALALVLVFGGCRSRGDDKESSPARDAAVSGPTMPTGMLVPAAGTGTRAEADSGALRVARNVKGGGWTELQLARPGDKPDRVDFQHWRDDSRFVSLEAMTLMHEPFARALPGFDLFLPRLYGPDALTRLAIELDAFAGKSSGPIVETARELAGLARETAAKGQSLWVLGP